MARFGFAWNAKSLAQRRIDDDDGVDMCGPVPGQPPDTMQLFGIKGAELALLIIPADTEPLIAAQRMRHASGQSSTMDISDPREGTARSG
ncbi:hypothetical protein [Nocardia araoensis]|uniref:hypothetical protein n=1 Tax=Nocardia araoensis TaxID=228600 RepID=UPI0024790AD8|nr:hypothetical protein [Nocardia araoensis]